MYSASFKILRDIAIGTFVLLHYTPIRAIGLNRDFHFQMESKEVWHKFGDKIAPKDFWADILEKPGTRLLRMEGVRTDGYKGYIRVDASPSERVHPGVYIAVNDHYQVGEPDTVKGAYEALEIIKAHWETSLERSKNIAQSLLEKSGN